MRRATATSTAATDRIQIQLQLRQGGVEGAAVAEAVAVAVAVPVMMVDHGPETTNGDYVIPVEGAGGSADDTGPETERDRSDGHSGVTSTKSLVGSLLDYPVEHDRRYCGSGPDSYYMPNDEMEQTRLNVVHQVYLLLLHGQLTLAPMTTEPRRILDIGTGTGEWAIAMAETYPNADVTGTDLSAIQPDAVPSNVFFEIDDAEEEWTFGQSFDLIHIRNLSGAFRHWPAVYRECYRHLRPGGYLELIEFDHAQTAKPIPDSYTAIFVAAVRQAAEQAGRPWSVAHLARGVLESVGFEEAKRLTMDIPMGTRDVDPSQKTIAKLWMICILESLEAGSLRLLTRELGWEPDQVRDVCRKVRRELTEGPRRLTTTVHFVIARKPMETTG
ncbi:MAG: hypothetical protein M1826_007632 [Phylliscum demangeonii]|nr:MAG: hypothetical protein M1826_007632 [Phylliscum demangeonii]